MANLDNDTRNLINHLWFYKSDAWNHMYKFLHSPDTELDADPWIELKPETDEVQLREEIREFVIQADNQMESLPGDEFVLGYPITSKPRKPGGSRPCFLAMPTMGWLPDVKRTIESAAEGFKCELSVDNAAPGNIMSQVWKDIRRSEVVVADMTELNPNVFYEMGLAHALGKTVILIVQMKSLPTPFDVSSHKYYEYDPDRLDDLEKWLKEAFRSVPKRYSFDPGP